VSSVITKTYTQLGLPVQYEFEEKRSRFLCFLEPVLSREQALGHHKKLQDRYPDARHWCWAYIIGNPQQPITQAYNDDGEPSGTAGKPMLHVLTQRGAGDTLAVVVRYFGGIKLGAGGLVRAYGASVSKALDIAKLIEKVAEIKLCINVDFHYEASVRHVLAENFGRVESVAYSQTVALTVVVMAPNRVKIEESLRQVTAGSARVLVL